MIGILQAFQGKALPVNAKQEDWLSFFTGLKEGTAGAAEVIGNVLINTEEGRSLCLYLYNMGVLDSLKDKCDDMAESFRAVVTVKGCKYEDEKINVFVYYFRDRDVE